MCYNCNEFKPHSKELHSFFKHEEGCMDTSATIQPSQKQKVNIMRSNPANQIIVHGTCNSSNVTFFVDTGSSVSLTRKSFIDSIGFIGKIKKTHITLTSFTSNIIKTNGEIILEINLAHCQVKHLMIIIDLVDTYSLIGLDFLKDHKMNIDVICR